MGLGGWVVGAFFMGMRLAGEGSWWQQSFVTTGWGNSGGSWRCLEGWMWVEGGFLPSQEQDGGWCEGIHRGGKGRKRKRAATRDCPYERRGDLRGLGVPGGLVVGRGWVPAFAGTRIGGGGGGMTGGGNVGKMGCELRLPLVGWGGNFV